VRAFRRAARLAFLCSEEAVDLVAQNRPLTELPGVGPFIEKQIHRWIAALRNPDIQILGHPRGRIYNYRLGLTADWLRVFAGVARLDTALEIDCYPDRRDLNLSLLKIARSRR
jgi:hypothetical protein